MASSELYSVRVERRGGGGGVAERGGWNSIAFQKKNATFFSQPIYTRLEYTKLIIVCLYVYNMNKRQFHLNVCLPIYSFTHTRM